MIKRLLTRLELKRGAIGWFEKRTVIDRVPAIMIFMLVLVYWIKSYSTITNPQFWAEDGGVFFKQAWNGGFQSIVEAQAGYFVIVIRLISWIATLFPIQHAPLICALGSIVLQALPIYLIFSPRTDTIFPGNNSRLFFALIYLVGPASYEIFGTITNIQWYLPVWTILFMFSIPASNSTVRILEYLLLLLVSLTGPFIIFLFPLYIILVVLKEFRINYVVTVIMGVCFVLQAYNIYRTPQASGPVDFLIYLKYGATKIVLNGLVGISGQRHIYQGIPSRFGVVLSLLIWAYTSVRIFVSGKNFARLIMILSNVIFFAGYRKFALYFSLDPEVGARYAWLGVTGYLFFYYTIASQSQFLLEKILLYLLCFAGLCIAIPADFTLFNSKNNNWKNNVRSFRWLHTGDTLTVRIDPDPMSFQILKKKPSDILKVEEGGDMASVVTFQIQNNVLKTLDTWAFNKNESASGNEVYLFFKSSDDFYVFPSVVQSRGEVALVFKGDYSDAGFSLTKSIAHVRDGTYSIGLFIYNNRTKHRTLKYLTPEFQVKHSEAIADEAKIYQF